MNIFKRTYIKWLIRRHFKKEFVESGVVSPNFSVNFDKEKNDFCISYTPLNTKDITEYGDDGEVVDENPKNDEEL